MIQGYFGNQEELFFEIDLIAADGLVIKTDGLLADRELRIPVLGGHEIAGVLMGLPWLETQRLVVDRKASLLTLEDG